MKLIDLYNAAVGIGIEKDTRDRKEIRGVLGRARSEMKKLKGVDRKAFDKARLTNPYADTRILNGNPDTDIRRIMVGIDAEGPEILLADRLSERGDPVDLVMTHHPEGRALAGFYGVMELQITMLKKLGLSDEVARDLLKERMDEVQRSVAPINHVRSVDVAKLLGIPYMCVHTPADNQVTDHLQRLFDKKKLAKLSQVVSMLKAIPEYADGLKKGAGTRILVGDPNKKAGKILVDMTGGTEGSKRVFPRLSQAGVGTVVAMHLSEQHFKSAKIEHINVVIAGHIASDSLGLNLLLDRIEKKERLEIIPCSGFTRVRRK